MIPFDDTIVEDTVALDDLIDDDFSVLTPEEVDDFLRTIVSSNSFFMNSARIGAETHAFLRRSFSQTSDALKLLTSLLLDR